jgi:hypothetical protein
MDIKSDLNQSYADLMPHKKSLKYQILTAFTWLITKDDKGFCNNVAVFMSTPNTESIMLPSYYNSVCGIK